MPCILHARAGWGSALVEAQLAFYETPFDLAEVGDLFASAEARESLRKINPVAQIPALVLPSGEVMTESAAITLHLADLARSDALVPGPDAPERAKFLRWLIYLVANIYPTFTFADDPGRFVADEAAGKAFRAAVDAYALKLWENVEAAAGAPWFLGERLSALDIYVAVMTRWRPRRPWFAAHAPKLAAIARKADAHPKLAATLARNFRETAVG